MTDLLHIPEDHIQQILVEILHDHNLHQEVLYPFLLLDLYFLPG
jgi:hypothetical protein